MAELKNMTVQALRDLAKRALGKGHSRLKTKTELIDALQAAEKKVTGAAGRAANRVKEATGRAARATEKMTERVVDTVRGRSSAAAKAKEADKAKESDKAKERAREKAREAESARERRAGRGVAAKAGREAGREPAAKERPPAPRRSRAGADLGASGEPDPEGHMVARVAGEDVARKAPHPMTEGAAEDARRPRRAPAEQEPAAPVFEEGLGELPHGYGDDAMMALPRDPTTLYVYWDHAQETLRSAWEGLDGGRPQIWVFARSPGGDWERVRVLDFALESRSYYVHDLEPGRSYRAEIHIVDRRGNDRLLPRPSNEMALPPAGPSPIVEDRFMRIAWGEPLQRVLREAVAGGAFSEEVRAQLARLSDWSRFAGRVWGGSAGGMGGRPFSPTAAPSSPSVSSPASPWGRWDGEGH